MPLRIAIQSPSEQLDVGLLRDLWVAADQLGYDGAYAFDHLLPIDRGRGDAQCEAWVLIAFLASHTRAIEVGPLVSPITFRNPALMLKMATTLDYLTGGRVVLGLGAGWYAAEHRAFGIGYPPAHERVRLLAEILEAYHVVRASDSHVTFHGEWLKIANACFGPLSKRPGGMPVLVGGSSVQIIELAARLGDVYNGQWAPNEWRHINLRLDSLIDTARRPKQTLRRSALVQVHLTTNKVHFQQALHEAAGRRRVPVAEMEATTIGGSDEHILKLVAQYRRSGVDELVLQLPKDARESDLERFAKLVCDAGWRETA